MKVDFELWHLIILLTLFFSACWAWYGMSQKQEERRQEQLYKNLDERFKGLSDAIIKGEREWRDALKEVSMGQHGMERDFLLFKAQLPEIYTRRDDYIRGSAVIEAKVDALSSQISEVKTLVTLHDRS